MEIGGSPAEENPDSGKGAMKRNHVHLFAMVIAVVLVSLIAVLYVGPFLLRLVTPPFPSDDTPLTEFNKGIVWSYRAEDYSSNLKTPFSNATFFISYPGEWGSTFEESNMRYGRTLNSSKVMFADCTSFNYSNPGSFGITGEYSAQGIIWNNFWILINDSDSDGRWDQGDSAAVFACRTLNGTVIREGFMDDTEYAIGIDFPPEDMNAGKTSEWHFAFHDGKLYSWIPEQLVQSY